MDYEEEVKKIRENLTEDQRRIADLAESISAEFAQAVHDVIVEILTRYAESPMDEQRAAQVGVEVGIGRALGAFLASSGRQEVAVNALLSVIKNSIPMYRDQIKRNGGALPESFLKH
jgi:hypothetical protein